MSQATKDAPKSDELEIRFVVGGKEFNNEADARTYRDKQNLKQAVEMASERICDIFGEDAVDELEDHFDTQFEVIVRETVESQTSLVNDFSVESPRVLVGQIISTIGRKVTQDNAF